jgi:hypothetical protein
VWGGILPVCIVAPQLGEAPSRCCGGGGGRITSGLRGGTLDAGQKQAQDLRARRAGRRRGRHPPVPQIRQGAAGLHRQPRGRGPGTRTRDILRGPGKGARNAWPKPATVHPRDTTSRRTPCPRARPNRGRASSSPWGALGPFAEEPAAEEEPVSHPAAVALTCRAETPVSGGDPERVAAEDPGSPLAPEGAVGRPRGSTGCLAWGGA